MLEVYKQHGGYDDEHRGRVERDHAEAKRAEQDQRDDSAGPRATHIIHGRTVPVGRGSAGFFENDLKVA